jgi:hypothetical protein
MRTLERNEKKVGDLSAESFSLSSTSHPGMGLQSPLFPSTVGKKI